MPAFLYFCLARIWFTSCIFDSFHTCDRPNDQPCMLCVRELVFRFGVLFPSLYLTLCLPEIQTIYNNFSECLWFIFVFFLCMCMCVCAFVEMFQAMILENEFAKPKFYSNIFVSILSFTKYLMSNSSSSSAKVCGWTKWTEFQRQRNSFHQSFIHDRDWKNESPFTLRYACLILSTFKNSMH